MYDKAQVAHLNMHDKAQVAQAVSNTNLVPRAFFEGKALGTRLEQHQPT